ncbi:28S ribosomal protein S31, mitochondrial [Protopterus annectens]|uniref:28S ribosomal protein S31, mitochondrial n=1 Tax=Protopterus annectens TaxID=7888 RepID=UPI001CFBE8EC|nr:28S ribosomal protein S31, mitochondrial [Protopterus annectens]
MMYRRCVLFISGNLTGSQNAIFECWVSSRGELLRPVNHCKGLNSLSIVKYITRRHFRASAFTEKEKDLQTSTQEPSTANSNSKDEEQTASGAKKDNLLNLIGGMKVELSTKKRFQALNMQKTKEQRKGTLESLESASSMFQKAAVDIKSGKKDSLSPELVAAASAVASSMPEHLKKQTESELLQQLRKHETESLEQKNEESSSIGNIIADMKVGKHPGNRAAGRAANQIQFDDDGRGYNLEKGVREINGIRRRKGLYGGKRLNIFPLTDTGTAKPPQTGLEEEKNVEFYEHIFLEKHLEGFPKSGPIRHFMELVVVGLSKNPCLTVQQKLGHIEWFRNYFQEKEDILKEYNVYLS